MMLSSIAMYASWNLSIKMNKTPDDPLDQQMLDYYNSKITAYEKMAATLSNSWHQ